MNRVEVEVEVGRYILGLFACWAGYVRLVLGLETGVEG